MHSHAKMFLMANMLANRVGVLELALNINFFISRQH